MEKKAKISVVVYITLVSVLGIAPLFLPPYISDLSYINWNGRDLSQDIVENADYFNETFTEFNETDHLYYYSVRGKTYAEKVAMITLQGLVNKYNTSLFVEETDYDSFWFGKLVDYYGLSFTNISSENYWDVIDRFNASISGMVIYDEDLIDTVNVATFLASLSDCIVITNQMKANFSVYGITIATHDLRNQFANKVELYTWAWTNYKHLASKKCLFNLDTNKARMRDYVIASNAFTCWLTPGPFGDKAEIELYNQILNETPQNIPVWGWHPEGAPGEYEGLRTVSHAGKYMVVSSWSNPTVYSAFHIPQFNQTPVAFDVSNFEIKNKIYLAIIVSDGDNIGYCHGTLRELWEYPSLGDIPIGFTVSPLLYKLNPAVLKYFYESATPNEYFVCPPSGAGYTYPDMNPAIGEFLSHTKPALDWCDMDQIWLLNGYEAVEPRFSDEILNAYTSNQMGLDAVFLNYHDLQVESNKLVNERSVFYSIFVEQQNEIIGKLKSLEITGQHRRGPLFVYIATNSWNVQFSEMSDMVDQLDPDVYEVLRPDQFSAVFKRYEQERPTSIFNEFSIFLIAALIPLITATTLLALVWIKQKNSNRDVSEFKLPVDSKKNIFASEKFSKLNLNLLFLFTDVSFLFAIKYLLYTSNLVILYFALLLLSVSIGVLMKKRIDNILGIKGSLLLNIVLLSAGFLLFVLDYRMVMLFGIPLGIILAQQFQTQRELWNSDSIGNRAFVFSFIFALIVINLFTIELYNAFKWVIAIVMIMLALFQVLLTYKMKNNFSFEKTFQGKFNPDVKLSQLKTLILAFLFIFLFVPTIAQERYYYHLIWGLEFYPTKLSLQFSIAAVFVFAVLAIEIIKMKKINFTKKQAYLIFLVCILGYIFIPFLIQGVIFFYLIHFMLIFGAILIIDRIFLNLPQFVDQSINTIEKAEMRTEKPLKGYNSFVFGFLFWFLFIFALVFTPPVTIVVDTYNLLEKAGIIGITELNWNWFFWTLFYIPSIYIFICLPITIFCLIYGVIVTISTALN